MSMGMPADRSGQRFYLPGVTAALGLTAFFLASHATLSYAQTMALPGSFSVGASGAATYNIPIAVPPGTAGMSPSLTLEYNSQGGNGLLGVGWSLGGLPSVGRCARTLTQDGVVGGVNYDGNDRFCFEGQRLIAISGTYGADGAEYRTEVESFTRVISHGTAGTGPAWFEVHTKSGQVMELGHTADLLVLAQGKPTARSWAVNKVSDSKANYFTVTYTNDTANGQAYPSRIDYTGNTAASLVPFNSVRFVYATRSDATPIYVGGSLMRITVRLTNVQTYAGNAMVADYKLVYQQSALTNLSLLSTVTACAGDGTCLPGSSLTWTSSDTLQFSSPGTTVVGGNWSGFAFATGDTNGDGRADLIAYYIGTSGWSVDVALSHGDGTFAAPINWFAAGNWSGFTFSSGDVNGDGRTDLIATYIGVNGWTAAVALARSDGSFSSPVVTTSTGDWSGFATAIGDVTSDGRADAIASYTGVNGWTVVTRPSSGDGSFSTPIESVTSGNWSGFNFSAADVNGDNRPDSIASYIGANGWNVAVRLSLGDGTFATSVLWTSSGNWSGFTFSTGDINGDGRADLIASYIGVNGWSVYVALSHGDGTFAAPVNWSSGGNWSGFTFAVADVNADGQADLIAYYIGVNGWSVDVALSRGDGTFAAPVSWSLSGNWSGFTFAVADTNGKGRMDLIASYIGVNGWSTAFASASTQPWAIANVTSGLGAMIAISYLPLTNSTAYTKDANAIYPVQDVQSPLYVASRVDTSNGVGGTYSSTYRYAGAKMDLSGRGFLGFRQIAATDLQTNIVQTTTYRQDFPYIGLAGTTTKSLNTLTLNQTTTSYQFSNAGGASSVSAPSGTGAPYRVSVAQSVAQSSDLDGTALPAVTTSYQYDAFGNPTQVVASTPDGFSKTTTNTYTNDATHWLLGRLTRAAVSSVSP